MEKHYQVGFGEDNPEFQTVKQYRVGFSTGGLSEKQR